MKNIMAMSAAKTYDLVNKHMMHAFPDKDPYPNEDKRFFIPVGPNGKMEYIYEVVNIVVCDPKKLHTLKGELEPKYYDWLHEYDAERNTFFGYSENVDFKFYFLMPIGVIRQPFIQTIRNSKAFSFDEVPVIGAKTKLDPIESGRAWIFGCSLGFYPLHGAIHSLASIDWDVRHPITSGKVQEGDIVYLYGTRPEQTIYYRCRVIKANKSETTVDESIVGGSQPGVQGEWVELEKECEYAGDGIIYKDLIDHGLKAGNLAKRRIVDPELISFFNEFDSDPANIVDFSVWENYTLSDDTTEETSDDPTSVDIPINKIEDTEKLVGSEKEVVVKARINQSAFRKRLLEKFGKCCLCGLSDERLLIASHIKPWKKSDETEKVDVENGMILCPNHDKLFDSGLISFDAKGKIMISTTLSNDDRAFLNVDEKSIQITEANSDYFKYHRDNIFKKGDN